MMELNILITLNFDFVIFMVLCVRGYVDRYLMLDWARDFIIMIYQSFSSMAKPWIMFENKLSMLGN